MKTDKKQNTSNSKGLQKLTESEIKIENIFALKKISIQDLDTLTKKEKNSFLQMMTHKVNNLKGDDLDRFLTQTEEITHPRIKNELWEKNHINIMWAITSLIKENGRMPTKTEISMKTDLSRQTVHKHLTEYNTSNYYTDFKQQFHIMESKVMTTVFQYAINGDMKAARLYLECIGGLKNISSGKSQNNTSNTLIQNQNNYIQIGGTILNQEIIKNLKPEQISTIEGILKTIEVK